MGFLIIGRPKPAGPYIPCLNQTIVVQKEFLPVEAWGPGLAARAEPASRRPCLQVSGSKRALQTGYSDRFFFVIFCSRSSKFWIKGKRVPVPTAWRILRLRMEETAPDRTTSPNVVRNESWATYKR